MFDLLLSDPFVPFTMALALLFGLLALEILLSLLGATLLGLGPDADVDLDIDAPDLGELDIDFGDADIADFDLADPDLDVDVDADMETGIDTASAGPAAWLGIGKMPVLIWVAAVLMIFGLVGLTLQQLLIAVIGIPLPAILVALPSGIAALWFARQFGASFASILPKTETTAMSARHLGRRSGTVTQGTAKRGSPAEVRIIDRHGNIHHLRAEPLKDEDEITAGTEVLVLRHKLNQGYRIVAFGADG